MNKTEPDEPRDSRPEVNELFRNLQTELQALETLLAQNSDGWGYQDPIYRFYHQSFKVFDLQHQTLSITEKLQQLAPNGPLNEWFMQMVKEGTGKTFSTEDNRNWLAVTRPILEAFFHARYFLEMAVHYGKHLEFPPRMLPSGWAAFLCLYNLR
jgi:hypothetical protein